MRTEIKVKEIIKELSGETEINLYDRLSDDIGLDSLAMVTLLIEVEEKFNILLDETDMNPTLLNSVNDVVEMVRKYVE